MHTFLEEAESRYIGALLLDVKPDSIGLVRPSDLMDPGSRELAMAVREIRALVPEARSDDLCDLAAERVGCPGSAVRLLRNAAARRSPHFNAGYARAIIEMRSARDFVKLVQGPLVGEEGVATGLAGEPDAAERGLCALDFQRCWLRPYPDESELDYEPDERTKHEALLVAAVLLDPLQAAELGRFVAPQDFRDERCRASYAFLCSAVATGAPASDLDLLVYLQRRRGEWDLGKLEADVAFLETLLCQELTVLACARAVWQVAGRASVKRRPWRRKWKRPQAEDLLGGNGAMRLLWARAIGAQTERNRDTGMSADRNARPKVARQMDRHEH